MARKDRARQRGPGRPSEASAKSARLAVRVEPELLAAVEAYRQKHGLEEVADAARHALRRILREEGLLS